ncbi:hypothetical protein V1527DRAFT_479686 [Lipomyces starkeyi]
MAIIYPLIAAIVLTIGIVRCPNHAQAEKDAQIVIELYSIRATRYVEVTMHIAMQNITTIKNNLRLRFFDSYSH